MILSIDLLILYFTTNDHLWFIYCTCHTSILRQIVREVNIGLFNGWSQVSQSAELKFCGTKSRNKTVKTRRNSTGEKGLTSETNKSCKATLG